MADLINTIHENSEKFLPAFARIKGASGGKPTVYGPLDFARRGSSPQVLPGESELGRWVTLAGCVFTVTDSGVPFHTAGPGVSGRPARLFEGATELLLTDRRLLGVVVRGETIVGNVNDQNGTILLFTFPLERVESVSIDLGRRLLGGMKEKRLHVMSTHEAVTDIFIDSVFAVPGAGAKGFVRYRGTMRDVLETFIPPVVAARRPVADQAELRQLGAVARGAREQSADEIGVNFCSE